VINAPDRSKHRTVAISLENIDGLLRQCIAGPSEDLPSSEEGDELGLGDVRSKSKEDLLRRRENLLAFWGEKVMERAEQGWREEEREKGMDDDVKELVLLPRRHLNRRGQQPSIVGSEDFVPIPSAGIMPRRSVERAMAAILVNV
jgi:hypothetical protein